MEYRACKSCGKIFRYLGYGEVMCPICKKEYEEKEQKIKKYIQHHPDAQAEEIAVALDIDVKDVRAITKEKEESLKIIKCIQCGTPVTSGKLCKNCKQRLLQNYMSAKVPQKNKDNDTKKEPKKGNMRFLKRS